MVRNESSTELASTVRSICRLVKQLARITGKKPIVTVTLHGYRDNGVKVLYDNLRTYKHRQYNHSSMEEKCISAEPS